MMKFKKNYVMQGIYFWNCVKKKKKAHTKDK